jgi:hypothetical protein
VGCDLLHPDRAAGWEGRRDKAKAALAVQTGLRVSEITIKEKALAHTTGEREARPVPPHRQDPRQSATSPPFSPQCQITPRLWRGTAPGPGRLAHLTPPSARPRPGAQGSGRLFSGTLIAERSHRSDSGSSSNRGMTCIWGCRTPPWFQPSR